MSNRNALFEGVVTKTNRLPVTTTLSNDGENNAAIIYNPQELQYELVASVRGHICEDNSTMDNLSSGGVFAGDWQDTIDYINIAIGITSDQDSATDGLVIQWSSDGVTAHNNDTFSILANKGKIFTFQPARRYVRLMYTNGITATTSFNLETRLSRVMGKPSSHRIQDSIVAEDDAELVKAVITGENPAGTFVNFQSTTKGNFKVSLEEFESDVSTNGNTQLRTTLYDEAGIPAEIDDTTHTIQIINYEHHEIHSGSHYFVDGVVDMDINHVLDFTWLMPNTTKWIHWTWSFSTESETLYQVYEGAGAINPLANTVTPINSDRNSSSVSGTIMKFEDQSNLTAANADTDVTGATLIQSGIIGAGKDAGNSNRSHEVIMKQNTLYCLRFTATTAGYMNFTMQWYEHTNK